MIYPTEDQLKDFCNTYEYAKVVAKEINLLASTDRYLDQVKGYDEYRASKLLEGEIGLQNWGWALGAEGGKFTKVFGTDHAKLNAWRDIWSVDNVYFGFTKCETLKGLVDAAPPR